MAARGTLTEVSGAVQATGSKRGVKRSCAPLLPPVMEAARMAQYARQYALKSGRTGAIRASLQTTCEAYLKLANAPLYLHDRGYVRLVRLLTETHLQALLRAAERRRPDARSVKLQSIFQLRGVNGREYVAAVQGGGDVLYAYPVPVQTFRPVKKYCGEEKSKANANTTQNRRVQFRNVLPRSGRSAFSSVSSLEATDELNEADSDVVSPSEEVVSETDDDDGAGSVGSSEMDGDDDLDEYEQCCADGKNLAQCQCNGCVLGEEY